MIHVITGPPCAGKSTYLKEHAKDGDLKVDFDRIAKTLGATESHNAEGIVKKAAFAARDAIIKVAIDNPDEESWIIHTQPTDDQMKAYKDAGSDIIVLDPGKDECLARAERDKRPQQTIDAINRWYSGKKRRHMGYLQKSFKADINDAGVITGYFSTYDREPDSYGDVIAPGAFTDTIKAREDSGHPFPLCWNHSLDVDDIIGVVDSIKDTDKGPLMTAHFLSTERAQKARDLVKSGAVYQFSFAYNTTDEGTVTLDDGTKANELRKLDIFEISIVPVPANQNAVVTEIKSGRRNSAKDADRLQQIIALAQQCLGEIDDTEEPEQQDSEPKANDATVSKEQTEAAKAAKDALLEKIDNCLSNMEVTK